MASERFRKIREYEERLSQMTLATKVGYQVHLQGSGLFHSKD
jgi:hypothetical protein